MKNFKYIFALAVLILLQSCTSEDPVTELPNFDNGNFDERNYIVNVPDNYNPASPVPLLFAIHGIGVNAAITRQYSGFDDIAGQYGYIVVYPDSYDGFWSDGCGCQYVEKVGIDDVKYIDYLIEKMKDEYNIDTNRIYAWGWSQGGIFVNQLACRRAEVFAGFASYIGTMRLPISSVCFPKKPVNMVMFNGTNDQDVLWEGLPTTEFAFLGIPELFNKWAGLSDCAGEPSSVMLPDQVDHIDVEKLTYEDCGSNREVVLYKIIDGIHTLYRNKEIDTSVEAVNFFNRHRLDE